MATLSADQVYAAARSAGATHDEAVILTAISAGESGWRTEAHNPNAGTGDNSFGLWQINMLGNMGKERARSWGLSSYDQLFDPIVNAKAAVSILRSQGFKAWTVYTKGVYKKFLPQAQSAGAKFQNDWQSPVRSLLTAQTDWSAGGGGAGPVASDVGTVIGGAQAYGAGAGGAGAPAGLPPGATPEQIEQYIRENFPQAAGFLDIPEIRKVLIDAAKGGWTGTKLQAEIQATNWWRTNGEASRQYYALKGTDPAQLKALVDAKLAELTPQLSQLGIRNGDGFDYRNFAESSIKYGWTADEVRAQLGKHLQKMSDKSGLTQGSEPDVTADRLVTMARTEYLLPVSRQDAERWAIDIQRGAKTEESLRDYFGRMAESRFPGLAQTGFTPGDYMAPIRSLIAETLELSPADVDLLDRRWADVLQFQGQDGKLRPMTLAEAERFARSRPEYMQTKGAKAEAASLAETLAKTFGAV